MPASGILLVDKPGGMTSHDVVARTRRAFGTRKVGHAGTLDPMATGLLVVGIEAATRLLTFVVGADKTYVATIRLGQSTTTDDADGEITVSASADALAAVTPERIADGIAALTGAISQVPSAVSAIKVDGRRAYDRVRAGEEVELAAREVVVSRFDVLDDRPGVSGSGAAVRDLDVIVDCSSGTYIRALARDLGAALGVGAHLTALRRTRVGPFDVADAVDLDGLADAAPMSSAEAAGRILPVLAVTAEEAVDLRHGKRLLGQRARLDAPRAAAIDPDGALIGIVERRGDDLKSAMNMPEQGKGAE
ncbi:tRNA pseudouridine(55) synthase TruB [Microbacterium capsulatum]|uniref:tRNA pseudouridine synthase B n=1 Tax=Microbacterium capsulatum TaxID=3041921 RepID=A0ABU0XB97_9MICO|nr:tRNA pseudouridine(55) synthase TruB [Microbacterium sp. ASV81]MDQ4212387.1 tRNA pseudouridine(55) synthase TruB [Microbacterium sp. ASV81]